MIRLTCPEADRLAHDLRQAEECARQASHFHADQYAAFRIIGNRPLAEFHQYSQQTAADTANALADYAERLSDRKPLWDTGTGPNDEPRSAVCLPRPPRRTIGGRR